MVKKYSRMDKKIIKKCYGLGLYKGILYRFRNYT